MGVKKSTSDLFIKNCDEFLYYDDLVRAEAAKTRPRHASTRAPAAKPATTSATPGTPKTADSEEALDLVAETLDAIREERDEDEDIWGSMIKQAIKRRNPGFNERFYGFRSFNDLLLEAQRQGILRLEPDEKSGGYTVRAVRESAQP
jgi:hypothetical protein